MRSQYGQKYLDKKPQTLELIYYEAFPNKFDALKRERYFKTTKGKAVLKEMLKNFLVK